jgi:hypothetical protein
MKLKLPFSATQAVAQEASTITARYFYGDVAEWFKAAVLKTAEGATPP